MHFLWINIKITTLGLPPTTTFLSINLSTILPIARFIEMFTFPPKKNPINDFIFSSECKRESGEKQIHHI